MRQLGGRRGRTAALALVCAALTMLGGCTTTVRGSAAPGHDAPTGSATPGDTPTASGSSPAGPGSCLPATPTTCMMAPPTGSRQWNPVYAPNGPIDMTQFLDRVYYNANPSQRQEVATELNAQGLRAIAHESWRGANSDDADVVLLAFAAPSGAISRNTQLVTSHDADTTFRKVNLPALTNMGVSVYQLPTMDAQGEVPAVCFAAFGQISMEFFFWSLATLDSETLVNWLDQEAAVLRTQH